MKQALGVPSNGKLNMNLPWRRKWQPTPAFAWKTPWTEEPGGLQSRGSQRVAHDLAQCTRTHTHTSEMEFTLTRQSLGNFSDSDYRKVKDQV